MSRRSRRRPLESALCGALFWLTLGAADADPLTHVDFAAWTERLAIERSRVVVVDMWATWCSTCLTRFPKMVEMARRYEPRGVVFLSLCLDDRDDAEALAAARGFLAKQEAPFEHFLMDERLDVAFEKLGLLGIPAVVIYGRDGTEAARLTGDNPNDQFDEADVEGAIERLLAVTGR
jgi:thiol-disulfide isomerase/thioredoxin